MATETKSSRHAGVYRRGRRWRYTWRDRDGTQRWGSEATEEAAWRAKSRRTANRRSVDAITVQAFARDWVQRYPGRTRTGISTETRAEYRRDLERHVLPFLGPRLRLVDLTPRHVSALGAHLVNDDGPGLADTTARRVLAPFRAMLAGAVEEGVLAVSPATGVRLPIRPQIEEDDEQSTKALTDAELARLLAAADPAWRCLLLVLALAGLRISEALALTWKDVDLDAAAPVLRVRRRWRKGTLAPPKSRYGKRDVPIATQLLAALVDREPGGDDDLVFANEHGRPLVAESILEPAMKRPARAAGVPWATFHSLRHTCATRLIAAGRSGPQVQRWLGHHSADFTMRTYAALHDNSVGAPLDLPDAAP